MHKKIASIIGIVVGIVIVIVGFSVQSTSNYAIGESIRFGGDFYTEMYAVTKDVGRAINYAINDLICAVGWLIVAIGLFDIAYFVCKMASCDDADSGNTCDTAPSDFVTTNAVQKQETPTFSPAPNSSPVPGGWTCTCGRNHAAYESSCICGVTKADVKLKNSQNN